MQEQYNTRQLLSLGAVIALTPALRLFPTQAASIAGRAGWLAPLAALPLALVWARAMALLLEAMLPGEQLPDLLLRLGGKTLGKPALVVFTAWCLTYAAFVLRSGADRLVGTVYPGARECFLKLREMGFSLYIVSNCQKGYIEDFLHTSGTEDLIDDHICFGDTLKPKSESIRLCVERNSLDWAVYVGDTQGDLDAVIGAQLPCSDAKVPFIFARYGFGSIDESAADLPAIDSLSQLPDLMEAYC